MASSNNLSFWKWYTWCLPFWSKAWRVKKKRRTYILVFCFCASEAFVASFSCNTRVPSANESDALFLFTNFMETLLRISNTSTESFSWQTNNKRIRPSFARHTGRFTKKKNSFLPFTGSDACAQRLGPWLRHPPQRRHQVLQRRHHSASYWRCLCTRALLGRGRMGPEGLQTRWTAGKSALRCNACYPHLRHQYDRWARYPDVSVSNLQETEENWPDIHRVCWPQDHSEPGSLDTTRCRFVVRYQVEVIAYCVDLHNKSKSKPNVHIKNKVSIHAFST